MSSTQQSLLHEADLIATFADSYQRRLASLIARSHERNHLDAASALSLCVETMGMLVDSHARLARLLASADGEANLITRRRAA